MTLLLFVLLGGGLLAACGGDSPGPRAPTLAGTAQAEDVVPTGALRVDADDSAPGIQAQAAYRLRAPFVAAVIGAGGARQINVTWDPALLALIDASAEKDGCAAGDRAENSLVFSCTGIAATDAVRLVSLRFQCLASGNSPVHLSPTAPASPEAAQTPPATFDAVISCG